MIDSLTFYTFIGLLGFFAFAEIYRAKFFVKGMILEFCPSELGIEEFVLSRMKVQLKNGQVVEAVASSCTMCLGNLTVGDEVSLSKKDERYIVNLPFKVTRKSDNQNNYQSANWRIDNC